MAVHGIKRADLDDKPKFREIAEEFILFIADAELVIHNAAFDTAFLDAELARLAGEVRVVSSLCRVLDTLALARSMHPGQRNNLDALCKRYSVDNSRRDLHGALLDAQILADVYLAMTGGQGALALSETAASARAANGGQAVRTLVRTGVTAAGGDGDRRRDANAREHVNDHREGERRPLLMAAPERPRRNNREESLKCLTPIPRPHSAQRTGNKKCSTCVNAELASSVSVMSACRWRWSSANTSTRRAST